MFRPLDPLTQPYTQLAEAGYVDLWPLQSEPGDGFTCCQPEVLRNGVSMHSERVDLLWVRNTTMVEPPDSIALWGAEQEERTDSGLWLSDHAGVLAEIRIPRVRSGPSRVRTA